MTDQPIRGLFEVQLPDGHHHYGYRCDIEAGGCGYRSPFYTCGKEGMQRAYDDHASACAATQQTDVFVTLQDGTTYDADAKDTP